ncbi:hypothetical protein BTVI_09135 [Pitangus sulphuratus]|nr:hypothetical protein BTVI_09135 [Pitangus sulphuratus]
MENMTLKVHHINAQHMPKGLAAEENQNNEQVDKTAKIGIAQVDLDWERKGNNFKICHHQGRRIQQSLNVEYHDEVGLDGTHCRVKKDKENFPPKNYTRFADVIQQQQNDKFC